MKRAVIIVLITILLSLGCRHRQRFPKTIYFPALNQTASAEVGENMFSKVHAQFPYKNHVLLVDSEDKKKYKTNADTGNRFGKLEGTECALYNRSLSLLDYNCDGYFTHLRNGDELDKPVKYKLIPTPTDTATLTRDSFKREVIYQGKVNNKIKLSFLEFYASKNRFIIRDAYTQSIEYELDGNGEAIIGFKGLRVKVLKATNFKIMYQVINDFN